MQRSLRVLDGGVVVFDAVAGVEPQSETVWRQADRYNVPRICFVNKMDRVGASFERTIADDHRPSGRQPAARATAHRCRRCFRGVVDLIEMKALIFTDELGANPTIEEIPADMARCGRSVPATQWWSGWPRPTTS